MEQEKGNEVPEAWGEEGGRQIEQRREGGVGESGPKRALSAFR